MQHWERANLLGDLILPVKVNPDLPIKLLFRRSRGLKGEECPAQDEIFEREIWNLNNKNLRQYNQIFSFTSSAEY